MNPYLLYLGPYRRPFVQEEAVTLAEAPTTAAAADAADEMGWTDAAAGNEHEGVDDEDEEAGLAAYADDRPAEPTQVKSLCALTDT